MFDQKRNIPFVRPKVSFGAGIALKCRLHRMETHKRGCVVWFSGLTVVDAHPLALSRSDFDARTPTDLHSTRSEAL